MRRRLGVIAAGFFVLFAVVSAACIDHTNSVAALVLIAPGYLVQAWLFERHRALGGLGYDITIVCVSATFWTVFVVSVLMICEFLVRHFVRRQES